MAYMVLKHTNPVLERADKWYVADMEHPEHHGRIVKKDLCEALDFCYRMNRGERFFSSDGETYEDGMRRTYRNAVEMVDGLGKRALHGYIGTGFRDAVMHVTGKEWDAWLNLRVNRSKRALDLG